MPIRELVVQVGDVDEAVDFYSQACGFTHLRTVEGEGVRIAELDAGNGQRLTLVAAREPGVHLVLPTDDAHAERRRLRRRPVPTNDLAESNDGVWVGFTDPWGNRLGYWEDRSAPGG